MNNVTHWPLALSFLWKIINIFHGGLRATLQKICPTWHETKDREQHSNQCFSVTFDLPGDLGLVFFLYFTFVFSLEETFCSVAHIIKWFIHSLKHILPLSYQCMKIPVSIIHINMLHKYDYSISKLKSFISNTCKMIPMKLIPPDLMFLS